jgi:hypothetical protein
MPPRAFVLLVSCILSGCSLTFYGLKETKEEPVVAACPAPPKPPVAATAPKKPEPPKKPALATNPQPPL